MKNKYCKGDLVRVKYITINEVSCDYIFMKDMAQYCGTVQKIIQVHDWVIRLSPTGLNVGWSPYWLEPVEKDMFTDKDFEI